MKINFKNINCAGDMRRAAKLLDVVCLYGDVLGFDLEETYIDTDDFFPISAYCEKVEYLACIDFDFKLRFIYKKSKSEDIDLLFDDEALSLDFVNNELIEKFKVISRYYDKYINVKEV